MAPLYVDITKLLVNLKKTVDLYEITIGGISAPSYRGLEVLKNTSYSNFSPQRTVIEKGR